MEAPHWIVRVINAFTPEMGDAFVLAVAVAAVVAVAVLAVTGQL